jgi:two-component system, OmpR family, KDP operon response regulator KdpE
MSDPVSILVIEDEPAARTVLQVMLAQQGYQCLYASTGAGGVASILQYEPNAILLDLGLPDLDGIEVTRRIRQHSAAPIIVVSARAQEAQKIAALDEGANDYVTKPFEAGELLARVRVALRAAPPTDAGPPSGMTTVGELTVDFDRRRVTVRGRAVHLTPIEYRLFSVLVRAPGRVLTHPQILQQVWGPRYAGQMNYLRVYMKKLRYKIEPEPARPKYLLNEPGVGYRLRLPE